MAWQFFRSASPEQGIPRAVSREHPRIRPAPEPLVKVASHAAVVVSQAVEVKILHQVIETHGHPAGPIHLLRRGLFRQRVGRAVLTDVKDAARFLRLARDLGIRRGAHARLQVAHFQDLDVRSQLRLVLGEVAVHIQHSGVGVPKESDASLAQIVNHLGGRAPLLDFRPGGFARLAHIGFRFEHAGDLPEGNGRAGKRAGDFRNAAGGAVGQPLARVGVGIIQRGARLQVQDHHGSLGVLDDRQDLGGSCVGSHVAENQIDAARRKACAGLGALGASSTRPALTTVAHSPMRCFHLALVALQALFEPVELRPVCRQPNPEYSHLAFFRMFHSDLRHEIGPSSALFDEPV